MSDGSVIIDVLFDEGGFKKGIDALNKNASTAFKGTVAAVGAVSAALTAAGSFAIKVGSDFEAGMSKVAAISGAAGDELAALNEKAKEMGATTKFSATEAASAFEYMAMAGWKTGDMLDGIEGIMNLAAASGEELASVSDIVTDALTAFGLSAADSAHFADVLAKASSSSNTNVALMGSTFRYVAPLAGAMGYSIEDTAVAIGLMANAGIKGEQAGTALRATLTRLVKPPKQAAEALEELNISATNSDGSMRPLSEILTELRQRFDGLSESERVNYAASIAGQEAMSGLLAIVNASSDDFNKLTKAIRNSDGAAGDMAETMQNNLRGQITILSSTVEGLGIAFYDNIKGTATNAVKLLVKTLSKSSTKRSFDDFSKAAGKLIEQIANLAAKTIPAAVKGFSVFASNLKEIAGAALAVYAAIKTFTYISAVTQMVQKMAAAWGTAQLQLHLYALANGEAALSQAALNGVLSIGEIAVGVLTGKIGLATAAQSLWNLALNANPIGIVVGAVAALAVGIGIYAAATKDATDETEKLNQADKELLESSRELNESFQDSAEKWSKNQTDLEAESKAAKKLSDELFNLSAKTVKTTQDKSRMAAIVGTLNEMIPELGLAINAETGELNMQKSAIEGVIQSTVSMAKAKAAQERLAELAKEQTLAEMNLEDIQRRRAEVVEQLNAKEAERKEIMDSYGSDLVSASEATLGLYDQILALKDKEAEFNAEIQASTENIQALGGQMEDTTDYMSENNMFEEISGEADSAADSLGNVATKSTDVALAFGNATTVIHSNSELTKEEIEDLQEKFEEYASTATDAFSAIEEKSALSVTQLTQNLQANQKAIEEWADNLQLAAERGVDQGLLQKLRDAGPEAAGTLRNLVNASDEEISKLNEVFQSGALTAVKAFNGELNSEAVQPNAKETVDSITGEFERLPPELKETADKSTTAVKDSIQSNTPMIEQQTSQLKSSIVTAMSTLPNEMRTIGQDSVRGLWDGMDSMRGWMVSQINSFAKQMIAAGKSAIDSHSPSKITAKEIGKPFAEGIGVGIQNEIPDVSAKLGSGLSAMVSDMESTVRAQQGLISARYAAQSPAASQNDNRELQVNINVDYHGTTATESDVNQMSRQLWQRAEWELRSRGVAII